MKLLVTDSYLHGREFRKVSARIPLFHEDVSQKAFAQLIFMTVRCSSSLLAKHSGRKIASFSTQGPSSKSVVQARTTLLTLISYIYMPSVLD